MAASKNSSAPRDVCVYGLDLHAEVAHKRFDFGNSGLAATLGPDQNLGVDGGGKNKICSSLARQGCDRSPVMRIVRVQKSNNHARVDDDYGHSSRKSSRYLSEYTSGKAPA